MNRRNKFIIGITCELAAIIVLSVFLLFNNKGPSVLSVFSPTTETETGTDEENKKDFIKYVEFNVTYAALNSAYKYDVESFSEEIHLNWIDLLAYLGAKYGGSFSKFREKDLKELVQKLKDGESIETITEKMKYFNYYREAYSAVLGGLVGEYDIEVPDENNPDKKVWVHKYGLKGFSPFAKYYGYSDFDDFGVSRSYGYKRNHLGHDMMGQTGTPIIAIESGYVEELGWNQYGGWRIGIRSFDKKRYYYYAHLRQNFPFKKSLEVRSIVTAGEVIGYLGHTGYSSKENVNNIETPHLHWGLQLIFDESQKECVNEIWVDCYALTKFLYKNRSETVKNVETKEYSRVYDFKDPAVDAFKEYILLHPEVLPSPQPKSSMLPTPDPTPSNSHSGDIIPSPAPSSIPSPSQ